MTVVAQAASNLRRWRAQPIDYVREQFGVTPDDWQAEALTAFADPDPAKQRISMQACAGPGKTALLAWMGWHFLGTQGDAGDHPKGLCTAVTQDNLKDNLWAEFAKWQNRSPFLSAAFVWTKERIYARDHEETWFLGARTWPKAASAEQQGNTLSGLHGGYVLAMVDESGSVPIAVLRAAEQALSTKPRFGKILQAGNPLSRDGMLYAASVKLRQDWHVIRITGDPDDPLRSPRIDIHWARQQIASHGRNNPWVQAYILGEFPETALGKLLSVQDVEAAMTRTVEEDLRQPLILGVDVGLVTDAAVIYPRRARLLYEPTVLRGASTIVIAAEVVRLARDLGATAVFVDAGGPGIGVVDQIRALGLTCVPVYFGGGADDAGRYLNKRTEMHVRLAEWIREGGALHPHTSGELMADLLEPEVTWNMKGQQQLEDKADVKARLGRSPDWGDAAALTFAYPVAMAPPSTDVEKRAVRWARREESHNEFAYGSDR